MTDTQEYTLNQILHAAFTAHGYTVREEEGKLVPDFQIPVAFDTLAYVTGQSDSHTVTRLDVEACLPDGRCLYEAYGDIGETVEEALSGNWDNFQQSALHVMFDAFDRKREHARIWHIGGIAFHAYLGDAVLKFAGERPELPTDALDNAMLAALQGAGLTRQIHFVRLFYSQSAGETDFVELMADNRNLPEAEAAVARLNWPKREHFYSLRRFVILVPQDDI